MCQESVDNPVLPIGIAAAAAGAVEFVSSWFC